MTTDQLVTQFLDWIAKRRSPNTLRFYTARLSAFRAALGSRPWQELTPLEIDDVLLNMNQGRAPDTVRGNVIALEQLQKFARTKLGFSQAVITDLDKPLGRERDRLPTPAEVEAIKAHSSPQFALIYQALRQSGARPNELARATVADWQVDQAVIVLTQHKTAKKTGRVRRIAVGAAMKAIIEQSLHTQADAQRPPALAKGEPGEIKLQPETPLFTTPRGHAWTSASLSQTFARARKLAGITDKTLVLYSARHEHATILCETLDLQAAADALDHKNLNTTRRYAKTKNSKLKSNQESVQFPDPPSATPPGSPPPTPPTTPPLGPFGPLIAFPPEGK